MAKFVWSTGLMLLLSACGGMIQQQAIDTAAADHNCPIENVRVVRDASGHGSHAYDLEVCLQRRFYRYDSASGRFVDDTTRLR